VFLPSSCGGIAILLFGRITVKHIEREMAKEGISPPTWDKGVGMRYTAYASIIMRPNAKGTRLQLI
jgi:hypothetical protein